MTSFLATTTPVYDGIAKTFTAFSPVAILMVALGLVSIVGFWLVDRALSRRRKVTLIEQPRSGRYRSRAVSGGWGHGVSSGPMSASPAARAVASSRRGTAAAAARAARGFSRSMSGDSRIESMLLGGGASGTTAASLLADVHEASKKSHSSTYDYGTWDEPDIRAAGTTNDESLFHRDLSGRIKPEAKHEPGGFDLFG